LKTLPDYMARQLAPDWAARQNVPHWSAVAAYLGQQYAIGRRSADWVWRALTLWVGRAADPLLDHFLRTQGNLDGFNRDAWEEVYAARERALDDAADQAARALDRIDLTIRKRIGPFVARGAPPAELMRLAMEHAEFMPRADVQIIVDGEVAWWTRWRHERGFYANEIAATDAELEGRFG
jgi:hypothetical protein